MKQLLQNVSTGEISIEEVPAPSQRRGHLIVATRASLISAGTERAILEVGNASMIGKARARPDLVKKVVQNARDEGIAATVAKVRGKLGDPNALGYSLAGIVLETCEDAPAAVGDLVACGGAGLASHAEIVCVPRNLCARVPDGVDAEDACYATVGAIAMHGVRLLEVGLGDVVAVVGLGLVGQIAVQLLLAAGCVVCGVDPDPTRAQRARDAGAFATSDPADLEAEVLRLTDRRGADGVAICAAASTPAPLATACAVARERATVSIVGDVPITSPRAPLFGKELRIVVSRSYGPGRYDPTYEDIGIDYPAGYVRWTEGRNIAETLRLMAAGSLRPAELTTHRFALDRGPEAYALLGQPGASMGIVLTYDGLATAGTRTVSVTSPRRKGTAGKPRLGVIGAGSFARGVLLPHLRQQFEIPIIANATGVSARAAAATVGAGRASTDPREIFDDPTIDAVLIATRHDTHAEYVCAALEAGKHVLVEKPLAIDREGLDAVARALESTTGTLMVGFNRRFAPATLAIRSAIGGRGPVMVTIRVNAGRIPASNWVHDPQVGGGRIVGEGCHFVDLAAALAGAEPVAAESFAIGEASDQREDSFGATLRLADGSVATILYSALGDPGLPKERVEVLSEVGAAVIDDFKTTDIHAGGRLDRREGKRDKGHAAEIEAFFRQCRTGEQAWPVAQMLAVSDISLKIRESVTGS